MKIERLIKKISPSWWFSFFSQPALTWHRYCKENLYALKSRIVMHQNTCLFFNVYPTFGHQNTRYLNLFCQNPLEKKLTNSCLKVNIYELRKEELIVFEIWSKKHLWQASTHQFEFTATNKLSTKVDASKTRISCQQFNLFQVSNCCQR